MDLPKPPSKKTKALGQSMLDKNREVEWAQAREEALNLLISPDLPSGKVTMSPIRAETLDAFEAISTTPEAKALLAALSAGRGSSLGYGRTQELHLA